MIWIALMGLLTSGAFASDDWEAETHDADRLTGDVEHTLPLGPAGIINGEAAAEDDWSMTGGLLATGTVDFFGF